MFRVLPWRVVMLMLCTTGCPSTGSSTDAAADRGLVDATETGTDAMVSDIVRDAKALDADTFDADATVPTDRADAASPDRPSVDAALDADALDTDALDGDATADTGVCPPGQSRSCRCGDSGVGGAVCTDAGVLGACDCSGRPPVLPPRLLTPHSVSRATTQRPTFRWVLPDGVTRARVTLARDRALTREARSETVTGASWRPAEALAFGVWFWRVEGLGDDGGTVWTSATWEFRAPRRDTAVDSSWGTLRDFNGDGYDDFALVSQGDASSRLVVFLGSRDGVSSTPSQLIDVTPPGVFWDLIFRVGDFNGDGLGDVAVSVQFPGPITYAVGAVDVYLGERGGLQTTPSIRIRPIMPDVPRWIFWGTIAVGDLDGDGFSDLLIGTRPVNEARYLDTQISAYAGSPSGVTSEPFMTLGVDGAFVTDRMNTLGDYNGDGYDDLLCQWVWLRADGTPLGAYFVPGLPRGLPSVAQLTPVPWAAYGHAITSGDLDGDGRNEAITESRNAVEIYRGAAVFSATMPDQMLEPPEYPSGVGRLYGSSVFSSTDINGDGFADLLVGAPEAYFGSLYLYPGRAGALLTEPSWRRNGFYVGSMLDSDRCTTGLDINGDGFDDLVSESINSGTKHVWNVDVFAGAADFRPTTPTWVIPDYRGHLPQ